MSVKAWLNISSKLIRLVMEKNWSYSMRALLNLHLSSEKTKEEKLDAIKILKNAPRVEEEIQDQYIAMCESLIDFYASESIEQPNDKIDLDVEFIEKFYPEITSFINQQTRIGMQYNAFKLFDILSSEQSVEIKLKELKPYQFLGAEVLKNIADQVVKYFLPVRAAEHDDTIYKKKISSAKNWVILNFNQIKSRIAELEPILTILPQRNYQVLVYNSTDENQVDLPAVHVFGSLEQLWANKPKDKRSLVLYAREKEHEHLNRENGDFFSDNIDKFITLLKMESQISDSTFHSDLRADLNAIRKNLNSILFVNSRREKYIAHKALFPLINLDDPVKIYQALIKLKEEVKTEIKRTHHFERTCAYLETVDELFSAIEPLEQHTLVKN